MAFAMGIPRWKITFIRGPAGATDRGMIASLAGHRPVRALSWANIYACEIQRILLDPQFPEDASRRERRSNGSGLATEADARKLQDPLIFRPGKPADSLRARLIDSIGRPIARRLFKRSHARRSSAADQVGLCRAKMTVQSKSNC